MAEGVFWTTTPFLTEGYFLDLFLLAFRCYNMILYKFLANNTQHSYISL